jgi:VanZ family protein
MRIPLSTTPALRALCIFAFAFTTAFILFHEPPGGNIAEVWDKAQHFTVYGGMAFMLWLGVGKRWALAAFVAVVLVGITDEIVQYFTPGREADVWDIVADAAGAGSCLAVARRLFV